MIKQQRKNRQAFLEEALEKAKKTKEKQFICMTKKIQPVHLIHIFSAAKSFKKDRFFWASPSRDFMMVGIGRVTSLKAREDRFTSIKEKWDHLLEKAIVDNPYPNEGTGVVAFGGMSFDPKERRTELWEKFSPLHLTLAKYTVIKSEEEYFLTTMLKVHEKDSVEKIFQKIKKDQALLFQEMKSFPQRPKIVAQEEMATAEWMDKVNVAIEEIKQEKVNKIVLARELRLRLQDTAMITPVLEELLELHQESYVFAFEQGEDCFVGATPERLIKMNQQNLLSTCLAGTAPRGETTLEDRKMADYLRNDAKNLQEHRYVVQMIRNRLEKYCVDVNMPESPVVRTLKDLHHLYTPVIAQMKEGASLFDIIRELHPTPALGGSPKEKALRFIREHEPLDRGWYGAPIGWLDHQQNGEFAVAIRSGLFQGDEVSLFAGCGIMKDSDPKVEYEETNIKFLPMLSALEGLHERD